MKLISHSALGLQAKFSLMSLKKTGSHYEDANQSKSGHLKDIILRRIRRSVSLLDVRLGFKQQVRHLQQNEIRKNIS